MSEWECGTSSTMLDCGGERFKSLRLAQGAMCEHQKTPLHSQGRTEAARLGGEEKIAALDDMVAERLHGDDMVIGVEPAEDRQGG